MEEGEEENEELLAYVGIVDCKVVLQVETTDVFRQLKGSFEVEEIHNMDRPSPCVVQRIGLQTAAQQPSAGLT